MSSIQENYILEQFSDPETNTPDTSKQQISTPDDFDVAFLLEVAENFQTRYIEEIIGYELQGNLYPRLELVTNFDLSIAAWILVLHSQSSGRK